MNYYLIIAGWYFKEYEKFYESISHLKNNIIVASHKEIPSFIKNNFETNQFDNYGGVPSLYNKVWNLNKKMLLKSEFIIFMHDDTIVKNFDFIKEFKKRLEKFHCIGNSQEKPILNNFDKIEKLGKYVKGEWFKELKKNNHRFNFKIVDFRCFAIRTKSLKHMSGFEDLYEGKNLRDTNISLRLFSAKLSYFFGSDSLDTLTDNWLESDYFITDKNDSLKKIGLFHYLKKMVYKYIIKFK